LAVPFLFLSLLIQQFSDGRYIGTMWLLADVVWGLIFWRRLYIQVLFLILLIIANLRAFEESELLILSIVSVLRILHFIVWLWLTFDGFTLFLLLTWRKFCRNTSSHPKLTQLTVICDNQNWHKTCLHFHNLIRTTLWEWSLTVTFFFFSRLRHYRVQGLVLSLR
jgi:hypothetical protein